MNFAVGWFELAHRIGIRMVYSRQGTYLSKPVKQSPTCRVPTHDFDFGYLLIKAECKTRKVE